MEPIQTQLTDEVKEKKRPGYVVKMPIDGGRWVKVGYAYFNPKTESFTVYFDILPDREKIVLFKNTL